MPCENLDGLDRRYRKRYGMSMVENLKELKAKGIEEFLKNQEAKYSCPACGGVVSVHDRKCYSCGHTL
jgi:rubrerythrin